MDVSWSKIGASQFTAYMAFANVSNVLGFRLAATLNEYLDYASCYVAAAVVQVLVTGWLLVLDPRQTARELPRPEGSSLPVRGVVAVIALVVVLVAFAVYVLKPLLTVNVDA
jgi:predicted MFS family arabinose efflux permease